MNKSLSIFAAVLATAALLTAVMKAGGKPSPDQVAADAGQIASLTVQLAKLQEDHQALLATNRVLDNRLTELELARPARATSFDPTSLTRRLDQLEAQQDRLAQVTRDIDKYGVVAAMETDLVDAYQTLLDENQPLKNRLKQVDKLKRYGHFDEKAAGSMMNLLAQTKDLNEKSGVLQALGGVVKTPEFRDRILVDLNADILAGNQSARYRYYAIEALEPMLPDPLVQQWLTHLAQTDPEYKLAVRAGQSVGITPPPPPARQNK